MQSSGSRKRSADLSAETPLQQRRSKRSRMSDEEEIATSPTDPQVIATTHRKIAIPRGYGVRGNGKSIKDQCAEGLTDDDSADISIPHFPITDATTTDGLAQQPLEQQPLEQQLKSNSQPKKALRDILGERIAEMQAGLPYVESSKRATTVSPDLLDKHKRQPKKPFEASDNVRIQRYRASLNCRNNLVKVLTMYDCQKIIVRNIDWKSMEDVASTCTALWYDFNLDSPSSASYDNWWRMCRIKPLHFDSFKPSIYAGTKRNRPDDDENDFEDEAPAAKRVMNSQFQFSVHDD